MKRKAILLNHEDPGLLTGKDVNDFSMFLQSAKGGAWFEHEIYSKSNISLDELNILIEDTRKSTYDYVIFYFSGHGGSKRGTFIELNPNEQCIQVSSLFNLSTRQLSIFDCCRSHPVTEKESFAMDESIANSESYKMVIRKAYEERVLEAPSQTMALYACSEGECAYDFGDGGVYTQNLLRACCETESPILLVSQAHVSAYCATVYEASKHGANQHPDLFMVKYPSRYQLPLAMNISRKGF